jgi:thiamine biosynthesis lipoprotein
MNTPSTHLGRRQILRACIGLGAGLLVPSLHAGRAPQGENLPTQPRHWQTRPLLGFGTNLALTVGTDDPRLAEQALDMAVADIRLVEAQMSLFNPASALSQLNRQGELRQPHPLLVQVLTLAQKVARRSHGAFDVTVQPLWRVYEQAQQQNRLPTADEVTAAQAHTGWQALRVQPDVIRFTRPHMAVTLNGIAQGFAADVVKARWQAMGIQHGLINTGEWSALGSAQGGEPWHLGIADPRDVAKLIRAIALSGKCVATSADNQTFFSPDFKHHHIFDPHTGYSPADVASVTVLADSAALADALTKVIFVAGKAHALQAAKAWGVDVLLVDKAGQWLASPGLRA